MKCLFCFHYQYCREFFWALLSIFFPFKRFVSDINFPSAARVWSQRVACAAGGFIISCWSVWEQQQIWRNEFEWIEQFSGAQTGGLFEWRVSRSLHRLGDGAWYIYSCWCDQTVHSLQSCLWKPNTKEFHSWFRACSVERQSVASHSSFCCLKETSDLTESSILVLAEPVDK